MPIVERTLTELKWCDHSLTEKNEQNENVIKDGKSCTVHTKFIQFLGFALTRCLSSLYKQKIKYILCSLICIWKRPCFLRKICQYTRISIAHSALYLRHCFLKHVENRKRKQRVIEAYLPPVLLASVINMADCERQSVDRRWYTLKRPYLKSSAAKNET